MRKIVVIISDTEAIGGFHIRKILHDWGSSVNNLSTITKFQSGLPSSSMSLFGETTIHHLNLREDKDLKHFVDLIKTDKKSAIFTQDFEGDGLIISLKNKQGGASVLKMVKANGGEVIEKEKPEVLARKWITELKVNREVSTFLVDFAGAEPEKIISTIEEISSMTAEQKKSLTIEKLKSILPMGKGGQLPWAVSNVLLTKPLDLCLEELDRAMISSSEFAILSMITRKVEQLYLTTLARERGLKHGDIGLTKASYIRRKYTLPQVTKMLALCAPIKGELMGEVRSIGVDILLKTLIIEIYSI